MNNQAEMERIAMESNEMMLSGMLQVCREKTMRKSHSSDQLGADEKKQFYNCVIKFFETPNIVLSQMQQMGPQMWFTWTSSLNEQAKYIMMTIFIVHSSYKQWECLYMHTFDLLESIAD